MWSYPALLHMADAIRNRSRGETDSVMGFEGSLCANPGACAAQGR